MGQVQRHDEVWEVQHDFGFYSFSDLHCPSILILWQLKNKSEKPFSQSYNWAP